MSFKQQVDEDNEPLNYSESTGGKEVFDIEQAIQRAGGFGRQQWLMLLFASFGYQGINFFIYNLAYLELVPRLECRNTIADPFTE